LNDMQISRMKWILVAYLLEICELLKFQVRGIACERCKK
jgi:hypothetical protein